MNPTQPATVAPKTLRDLRNGAINPDTGKPHTVQSTATAARLSTSAVTKLECGLVPSPAFATFRALADVYGVPVEAVAAAHAVTMAAESATAKA